MPIHRLPSRSSKRAVTSSGAAGARSSSRATPVAFTQQAVGGADPDVRLAIPRHRRSHGAAHGSVEPVGGHLRSVPAGDPLARGHPHVVRADGKHGRHGRIGKPLADRGDAPLLEVEEAGVLRPHPDPAVRRLAHRGHRRPGRQLGAGRQRLEALPGPPQRPVDDSRQDHGAVAGPRHRRDRVFHRAQGRKVLEPAVAIARDPGAPHPDPDAAAAVGDQPEHLGDRRRGPARLRKPAERRPVGPDEPLVGAEPEIAVGGLIDGVDGAARSRGRAHARTYDIARSDHRMRAPRPRQRDRGAPAQRDAARRRPFTADTRTSRSRPRSRAAAESRCGGTRRGSCAGSRCPARARPT